MKNKTAPITQVREETAAIERKANSRFLKDRYGAEYETLVDMQCQNKWLKTKEGAATVGSDNVKTLLAKNEIAIQGVRHRLSFLKKTMVEEILKEPQ